MAVINCLELDEKLEPIAFHHTHSCEVFSFNPGNFPSDDMFATNVATVATGLRRKTNRSASSEQRLKRSLSGVRSEVFVTSSTRPSASALFLVDIVVSGCPSGNVSPLPLRLRCP